MIRLRVNGRDRELPGPTPLLDYLATLGADPRGLAVEVNGEILERATYPGRVLDEGDVVEIVRMVGGGSSGSRAPGAARAGLTKPPPDPAREAPSPPPRAHPRAGGLPR